MKLIEGLKENDLKDLVLPLISIDEYESKLDDDAIVVGLFVLYKDPANDINRFIQKSAVSLLDTDVSPAPTEDGYYMVFLEFLRDPSFVTKLLTILAELKGLADIDSWQFKVINHNSVFPVDEEKLKVLVRLEPEEEEDPISDDLEEFFKPSILDGMKLTETEVILERKGVSVSLQFVDFGTVDELHERNNIMAQGIRLDEQAQRNTRRLQSLLGAHWLIEQLGDYVLLSHDASESVALLRL